MQSERDREPLVWLWADPNVKCLSDVLSFIKSCYGDKDLVILHLCDESRVSGSLWLPEYILKLCETFDLLENDRTTFLSYKDHLLAMELCLSQLKQKNDNQESKSVNKEVLQCHALYTKQCLDTSDKSFCENESIDTYREFLKHSNCLDLWSLHSLLASAVWTEHEKLLNLKQKTVFLVLGAPESEVVKRLIEVLSGRRELFQLTVESSLSSSPECSPSCEPEKTKETTVNVTRNLIISADLSPKTVNLDGHGSATEEYAEEVILSFLTLLVNCRNELALSKAMISPVINLSHQAFTDVKHVALEKEMPMCQTVISYVTRVRLGGSGYAPPSDCPLQKHLKGLEQFVDLLNQLQTVIEEEASSESAIKRAVNILKNKLVRCSSDKLRKSSVEEVAKKLTENVLEIIKSNQVVTEKTSPQLGHKAVTALKILVNRRNCSYSSSNAEYALEQETKNRTPLNLPPLMGYFRSPEEESNTNDDSKQSLQFEPAEAHKSNDSASLVSYFHSSDSCSKSCVDARTPPSRLTFNGCLQEINVGNNTVANATNTSERIPLKDISETVKPCAKRSILKQIGNEVPAKKANIKPSRNKKTASKVSKAKPQIKGQGQITKFFFRV